MKKLFFIFFVIISAYGEIENDPYSNKTLYERYGNYGSDWIFFPDGNGKPTVAILRETMQTETRFANFVEYWLYTKDNPDNPYLMDTDNENNLEESFYDINKPTKFIIHGWQSSGTSNTCQTLKDTFLQVEDSNVIIVHWEDIASNIFYPVAAGKTKDVGRNCGKILNYLLNKGTNPKEVHIIGHSLGAHIAGICASDSNAKISRVTGLDPASPGFEKMIFTDLNLNKDQADFVDIIHTCAGVLGYLNAIGTVDIYPNGGTPSQPGCNGLAEIIESCSHGRSWEFFAESITSNTKFKAVKCDSWTDFKTGKCNDGEMIHFGYQINKSAEGIYYTKTNSSSPYALKNIF